MLEDVEDANAASLIGEKILADMAMYHAKKSGKRGFRLFAPDMRPDRPAPAPG